MPVYNRPDGLRRCIAAIAQQSGSECCELIVVDDGSEPPLQRSELIAVAPTLTLRLLRQSNAGPGAARNSGLHAARGAYLWYLDSDDALAPGAIAAVVDLARSEPDVIVGRWQVHTGQAVESHAPPAATGDPLIDVLHGGWPTGAVIVKRALEPTVSAVRMPWEMYECWMQSCARASAIAHCNAVLVVIDATDSTGLSAQSDHFEVNRRGWLHVELKARFADRAERAAAFDQQIFNCAFSLHHSGRRDAARRLYQTLDGAEQRRARWAAIGSPAWFAARLGFATGLELQAALSRWRSRWLGVRPDGAADRSKLSGR